MGLVKKLPFLRKIPFNDHSRSSIRQKILNPVYELRMSGICFSFCISRACGTLSNAFLKSSTTACVVFFASAVLANLWNVVQSCVSQDIPSKSMLSDVEEVIKFLVHIMEYNVFHHFTWNNFISSFMNRNDICQFPLSGKLPRFN